MTVRINIGKWASYKLNNHKPYIVQGKGVKPNLVLDFTSLVKTINICLKWFVSKVNKQIHKNIIEIRIAFIVNINIKCHYVYCTTWFASLLVVVLAITIGPIKFYNSAIRYK